MTFHITFQVRDAALHIPTEEYDEEGNVIGPNPDFDKQREEAQGKFRVRLICEEGGKHIAYETANGTDLDELHRIGWHYLGRAVVKRALESYEKTSHKD